MKAREWWITPNASYSAEFIGESKESVHFGYDAGPVGEFEIVHVREVLPDYVEPINIYRNPRDAEIFRVGHQTAVNNLLEPLIAENSRLRAALERVDLELPIKLVYVKEALGKKVTYER